MARIFSNPRPQFFKEDGVTVNSSGKLYFYEPGAGSTTLKSVYSNKALTSELTNPVILDSNGRAPTIFLNGDYSVKMTDSADVTVWTTPNYEPPVLDAQFSDWDSTLTYAVEDFARGSDGNYYQSLSSGNIGNNPVSAPAYWVQIYFMDVWNTNKTYPAEASVQYDGEIYISLQASTGNQPDISAAYWRNISPIADYIAGRTYSEDDIVKYQDDIFVSIQNSNTGNTPSSSSSFWRSFFFPSTASGYSATTFEYRNLFGGAFSTFDVYSNVTESTYESIGPTGSGADHVWAALDGLDATSLILKIAGFAERSGSDANINTVVSSRTTGSSVTTDAVIIDQQFRYGGAASAEQIAINEEFTIPVDASGRFDIFWAYTGDLAGQYLDLYLMGYKV